MTGSLIDNAPFGYFSFSDDWTIVECNGTLAALLKYDHAELEGKQLEMILTLPTRIFFQTHFFPLTRLQKSVHEIFMTLLAKDGEHVPVLLNAKRVGGDEGRLTACAFIVVHNRKKFEDELVAARNAAEAALNENSALQKAREELLIQTARLEQQVNLVRRQNNELVQFSHVVTHNLKEPLRKILVYADKLNKEYNSPTFDKLNKANEQMRSVVTGLQEYIWLNDKDTRFEPVDLSIVLGKALAKLSNDGDQDHIELNVQELETIEADEEQLVLMFYHLLSNAVKFRKGDKARVTINTTMLKQNMFKNLKGHYHYTDFARLEFRDEGVGFDPVFREEVFDLYRKFHFSSGQGLGLSMCRKIAENHEGYIQADSEVNGYTKITVMLPLKRMPILKMDKQPSLTVVKKQQNI